MLKRFSAANIPITYYNKTGTVDFDVVVFAQNCSTRARNENCVVWQVLRGETSVSFNYPEVMQVGASYTSEGQKIQCGPFDAVAGTTWEIIQEMPDVTAKLRRGIIIKASLIN